VITIGKYLGEGTPMALECFARVDITRSSIGVGNFGEIHMLTEETIITIGECFHGQLLASPV
jgi:hypothetical protein